MSIWKALDQQTSAAMDETFGERFRLLPRTEGSPNGRREMDQDRAVVEGICVFDNESTKSGIRLGVRKTFREANDLRVLSQGREPKASIDLRQFPTLADQPRQGDKFELLDRDIAPFEVTSAERDGQARIVVRLIQEGSPS